MTIEEALKEGYKCVRDIPGIGICGLYKIAFKYAPFSIVFNFK